MTAPPFATMTVRRSVGIGQVTFPQRGAGTGVGTGTGTGVGAGTGVSGGAG